MTPNRTISPMGRVPSPSLSLSVAGVNKLGGSCVSPNNNTTTTTTSTSGGAELSKSESLSGCYLKKSKRDPIVEYDTELAESIEYELGLKKQNGPRYNLFKVPF